MIHATRGIVFRTVKFSETSVVCKIYTERFGIQSYIVNGIRSAKSKTKASLLQPMSLLELQVYHRENKNLNRIREMHPWILYKHLLFDPLRSSLGLFMVEVLNKCIHEEEANAGLFDFIASQFTELDGVDSIPPDTLLRFLLKLSGWLGFYPSGAFIAGTPEFDMAEGKFTSASLVTPYVVAPPLSEDFSGLIHGNVAAFPREKRQRLLYLLLEYYQLHVPNFCRPRSLLVLQEVFHD